VSIDVESLKSDAKSTWMKPIRWRAATAQKVPPPDSLTQRQAMRTLTHCSVASKNQVLRMK
jgi:glucose-6-phosphate dehydrogenase assembly protein OpcA